MPTNNTDINYVNPRGLVRGETGIMIIILHTKLQQQQQQKLTYIYNQLWNIIVRSFIIYYGVSSTFILYTIYII